MKKKFLVVWVVIAALAYGGAALWAATTVSAPSQNDRLQTTQYVVTWTAVTAGVVATASIPNVAGAIVGLETIPGSPAPTTLYDITLVDSSGVDVAQGDLLNLSATIPARTIFYDYRWLNNEDLVFTLANNSVTNAAGVLKITVRR